MTFPLDKTWTDITPYDIEIETKELPHRGNFSQERTVINVNGIRLYRTSKLFEKESIQFTSSIILNENDFEKVSEKLKGLAAPVKYRRIFTINKFFSHFPNTKIYIRTIGHNKNSDDRRVFTAEALEFIHVLMKRQHSKRRKPDCRWDSFLKRLKSYKFSERNSGFSTMTLPTFAKLLKEYYIDASLFTLVPDFDYAHQVYFIGGFLGFVQPVAFWGPYSEVILHGTQNMFAIFTDIVLNIDWNINLVCTEPDCRNNFREAILRTMQYFSEFDTRVYKKKSDFPTCAQELRQMCYYRISETTDVGTLMFSMYDNTDRMRLCYFLSLCERLGFASGPANLLEQFHEMHIPMWKMRVIFMIFWAEKFFDNEPRLEHLRKVIMTCITSKIPCRSWNYSDDTSILDILLSSNTEILDAERQAAVINATEIECIKTYHENVERAGGHDRWFDGTNFILCGKWEYTRIVGTVLKNPTPENAQILRNQLNEHKKKVKRDVEQRRGSEEELARKANEILRKALIEKVPIDSIAVPEDVESPLVEPDDSETLELLFKFEKRTLLQQKHVRELRKIVRSAVKVRRSEEYRKELQTTQKMPYYTNCKPSTSSS